MADTIETVNGSVIQHGHYNDRIYLMQLNPDDVEGTLATLTKLAKGEGYGKIFARIPSGVWTAFKTAGYRKEAVIPGFYRGRMDGLFVARYFSSHRQTPLSPETMERLHAIIDGAPPASKTETSRTPRPVFACGPADTTAMGHVYRRVFKSYPFPIGDPEFLNQVMEENAAYFGIQDKGPITALAAIEIDRVSKTAEMTDFATIPEWRRHGLADTLLKHMENETRKLGIKTTYTIARAASPGINRLFQSNGYRYAGLLLNNTHICGSIQSMTVWYKHF